MTKRRGILLLVIIMLLTSTTAGAVDFNSDLRSYLLIDYDTDQIVDSYDAEQVVEIASITKLMTYMVVMDSGKNLNEKIIMDKDSLSIGGSGVLIEEGEEFTLDELINLSLVLSANNATYKMAKHIAGSEDEFVKLMNKKAREIGLEQSVFYNSTGLPPKHMNDQNKMSMEDLAKMSKYAIKNYPDLLKRTSISSIMARDFDGKIKEIKNTNPLLGYIAGVDGLKTGFTNKAGYSLVASYKAGKTSTSEEMRLIAIIMGAKSESERNRVSREIMTDVSENYIKKEILGEEKNIAFIEDAKVQRAQVIPKEKFTAVIDKREKLDVFIEVRREINFPIKKGEKLGEYKVYEGDKLIFSTDALAAKKIKRAGFIRRGFRKLKSSLDKIF